MDAGNTAIRDYYLLPWLELGSEPNLRLAPENGFLLDAYPSDALVAFFDFPRGRPLRRAA